jgi:hypothetical protein
LERRRTASLSSAGASGTLNAVSDVLNRAFDTIRFRLRKTLVFKELIEATPPVFRECGLL